MKEEAIIVLGCKPKGGKLSDLGHQRLEKAFELYSKKKVPIILSGGYSLKSKKGIGPSEAKIMKGTAINLGIDRKDIFLEEESRDTQGNAYFTKQIVKQKGWSNILVVTSDFHLMKARFFFDFIYGVKFKISYVDVRTGFSKRELAEIEEKEKRSRDVMVKMYKENNISPGEDAKVMEILRSFYSKYE